MVNDSSMRSLPFCGVWRDRATKACIPESKRKIEEETSADCADTRAAFGDVQCSQMLPDQGTPK